MKKYIFIGCLTLVLKPVKGQFITSTLVETWATSDIPSEDYHLNSSYLFLINPHALKSTFEGEYLQPNERREIGIKKGDLPRYMYLAVLIPNPLKDGDSFTVPLMIQDMRNPAQASRVAGYGGRVLENIPDDVLKGKEIIAKVRFETIRDNNNPEFWKKTAQISIDLGRTASSLLANPLTGSLFLLTQQIIPQISKGISSLQESDQPDKVTSEFFIKLMDNEFSAQYKEKVISAGLYKIHWDGEIATKTRFLKKDSFDHVMEIKNRITSAKTPYILVVQTKSEFTPDHSTLTLTNTYLQQCKNDFVKIHNELKRNQEREFIHALEQALVLKEELNVFKKSLNTRYTNWTALARSLDIYLNLLNSEKKLEGNYRKWFSQMIQETNNWFDNPLLQQGFAIIQLISGKEFQNAGNYEKIKILDFYRSRLDLIKVGDRLPEEIESMEISRNVQKMIFDLERQLFESEFTPPAHLADGMKRIEWMQKALDHLYPLCSGCRAGVAEEVNKIRESIHRENLKKFRIITADFYNQMTCLEKFQKTLLEFIGDQTNTVALPETVIDGMQQDQKNLAGLMIEYNYLVGKDVINMAPEQIVELLDKLKENRYKIEAIGVKLQNTIQHGDLSCFLTAKP
jgi:hypothetical protein